jgi:hypothetical protein
LPFVSSVPTRTTVERRSGAWLVLAPLRLPLVLRVSRRQHDR